MEQSLVRQRTDSSRGELDVIFAREVDRAVPCSMVKISGEAADLTSSGGAVDPPAESTIL